MHLLPTLWFRNTWSWGAADAPKRPMLRLTAVGKVSASHETLGDYHFAWHGEAEPLFTENETNAARSGSFQIRRPTLRTLSRIRCEWTSLCCESRRIRYQVCPPFHLDLARGEERTVKLRLSIEQRLACRRIR